MKSHNFVFLEGTVGTDLKSKVATNGKKYITFSCVVQNNRKSSRESVTNGEHLVSYLRVFIYNKQQIEYLEKMEIKSGKRVQITGRLEATSSEVNGKRVVNMYILAEDISIIKTK